MSSNLVIKPIEFEYEDTNFSTEAHCDAYGVFDWKSETKHCGPNARGETWSYLRETYAYEWIACFVEKTDAEFYLNWKQNASK